jgi:hypothetical protein
VERGLTQIALTIPPWTHFFGRGDLYSGVRHSVARFGRCSVGINWQRYENSLSDSQFTATVFDGHISFHRDSPAEKMHGYAVPPKKLTEMSFKAGRCPGVCFCWKDSSGKWITAEEVAGRILETLVNFERQFDRG